MFVAIFILVTLAHRSCACTTFAVGKRATVDGSVFSTHSNDGGGTTDPRLVKIPARDYAVGAKRPIYASPENYPRYVGAERQAEAYFPENCQAGSAKCASFEPIGYIPQVNHTFAYFEATYGTMNEKQVALSESTCSGVYVASAINAGGAALLSIDQLSQIAMERASTAREAITIMGELSEEFGFYGESTSFEGGSESLFVIDPNKKIRLTITYPASTGRNFHEILRVIDSLQLTDNYKVATPANWQDGDEVVIVPSLKDEEEIKKRFPKGYRAVKPYLRLTPQPNR